VVAMAMCLVYYTLLRTRKEVPWMTQLEAFACFIPLQLPLAYTSRPKLSLVPNDRGLVNIVHKALHFILLIRFVNILYIYTDKDLTQMTD
jgi:hypothetical protein